MENIEKHRHLIDDVFLCQKSIDQDVSIPGDKIKGSSKSQMHRCRI